MTDKTDLNITVESASFSMNVEGALPKGYCLTKVMPVLVEQISDGSWLVSDDVLLIYGNGETIEDAFNDYRAVLVDQYEIMLDFAQAGDIYAAEAVTQFRDYIAP